MKASLLLALLLVVLAYGQQAQLQQIKNRIQQTSIINANSIGAQLAGYLSISINATEIPASNITFQLSNTDLIVTFRSVIFGSHVDAIFYFFYVTTDLELAFTFSVNGTLQQLYKLVTDGKPVPETLQDLKATGLWKISFSSSSSSPAPSPITKGLTLEGDATIFNGTLLNALHRLSPSTPSLDVDASLYFPLFGSSPNALTVRLSVPQDVHLSSSLSASSLIFTVTTVPADIVIDFVLHATVHDANGNPEVLLFHVTGNFNPATPELDLSGVMTGSWKNPLGIQWLTVVSATGKLVLKSGGSQFSVSAVGSLPFSSSAVSISVIVGGTNGEDIYLEIDNIPISQNLPKIFTQVSGKNAPAVLSGITVSGKATIIVATYSSDKFTKGFTLDFTSTVTDSKLLSAVRILKNSATSSSFSYTGNLFIPIFGPNLDITLKLSETGSFSVTKHTSCDSFFLDVDVSDSPKISIGASLETTVGDGTILKYQVLGNFLDTPEVDFTGTLNSAWVHPFSLSWFTLSTGKISITLGGPQELDVSISGSAALTFLTSGPVTVSAEVGGPNLENILFSVSGIPIQATILEKISQVVGGRASVPSEISELTVAGTIALTIATFNSPNAQEGFTCTTHATVQQQGSLYHVTNFLTSNPTSLVFDLSFFIPVFGPSGKDASLTLSESSPIHLTSAATLTNVQISVTLGTVPTINVNSGISVSLKRQTSPLVFGISAAYTGGSTLSFSGTLSSTWAHPFGFTWLDVTSARVAISLSAPVLLQSFSISGNGEFHFGTESGTAGISLSVSSDLDATLTATLSDKWTISAIATSILGKNPPALLAEVSAGTANVALTISTASGVTLDVSGQVTGDLRTNVKRVSYWWNQDLTNLNFDVRINIPIFSANPLGVSLALTWSEEIQINKHLWFESITFNVDAVPFSIGLDAKVKAEFQSNPVLYFEGSSSFQADNGILIWAAMEGTWVNPFGIKGFDLSDVILQLGFNPMLCEIDACISDFGLGTQLTIGNKIIKFDGNVEAPDFWNVFLEGSISGPKGQSLAVLDIINKWNKVDPSNPVSTSLIPSTWGITDCSFYFAPVDGQFGPIHYAKGFGITGGFTLLDMDLFVSLNCTDSVGLSCNFAFDININLNDFGKLISKELGLIYGDNIDFGAIFSLKQVSLTEWNQRGISQGVKPRWIVDIEVLGKDNLLDFRVEQYELSQTFHSFFNKWLASIFHLKLDEY